MAYTITDDTDTTDLGNVQTDGSNSSNGLLPITLPDSGSDTALLIPTTGPEQRFTLSSIKTGSTATLTTFIAKLQKWIDDGGKLSKSNLTYNSELDGSSLSVRAIGYAKSWVAGKPRVLNYSLELVRGTFT